MDVNNNCFGSVWGIMAMWEYATFLETIQHAKTLGLYESGPPVFKIFYVCHIRDTYLCFFLFFFLDNFTGIWAMMIIVPLKVTLKDISKLG